MVPAFLLLAACASEGTLGDGSAPPGTDSAPWDVEGLGGACEGVSHPRVVIHEVVTANIQGLLTAAEDTPDWIEIANLDDGPVDLAGWGLSDDASDPWAYTFGEDSVADGAVRLVFASGEPSNPAEEHAPFSLANAGETLRLTAPDGCTVDLVEVPWLPRDVAWGRTPEDPAEWSYFLEPTPLGPNVTEWRPGFAQAPVLDPVSSVQDGPVTVTVESEAALVTLTFDGSAPTEDSEPYTGPLTVDARPDLGIVRARAFVDGLWPSPVATGTYPHGRGYLDDDLQVVSLVIDPFDLYDDETGIYTYGPPDYTVYYPYFDANFWEDWERDLHLTVFTPDGTAVIDQDAGVKIHGGYTRAFEQKNWRLLPRSAYGHPTLDHAFFPNMAQDAFEVMVLEGSGDWCPTHTENSLVDQLFRDADGVRLPWIDSQAWEPTVVYLNGEFWGLYSFREKLDERYVAWHHGADPDALDRIECTADGTDDWWKVQQGDSEALDALDAFVAEHDLADPAAYAEFRTLIDVENLATAVLAVGFMANGDWWSNNLKLWRERTDPGPFRHMVFDLGHGWGSSSYDHFGVSIGFSGRGLPIADAVRNDDFRVLLANQASDYLNTVLRSDHAVAVLDDMHARIEPVIPAQYALWCGAPTDAWYASVDYARSFAEERAEHVWGHVRNGLGLEGATEVTLEAEPEGTGTFRLTAVAVEGPFTGRFWKGLPVTVTAVPAEGFTFAGWSDGETEASRTEVLTGPTGWVARFE